MTDLVSELRRYASDRNGCDAVAAEARPVMHDAADRIKALEAALVSTCQREAETILRHDAKVEALEAKLAEETRVSTMRGNMIGLDLMPALHDAEAKLAKAVEAVRFYSDPDHWEPPYASPGENPFSVMDDDQGKVARATLAELTGGKDD